MDLPQRPGASREPGAEDDRPADVARTREGSPDREGSQAGWAPARGGRVLLLVVAAGDALAGAPAALSGGGADALRGSGGNERLVGLGGGISSGGSPVTTSSRR
jgi:hypothetical protein